MNYTYTAIQPNGTKVDGQIEAGSPNLAASSLIDGGLTPIKIKISTLDNTSSLETSGPMPSILELQLFSQQMAAMLKAGVPILRSLAAAGKTTSASAMTQVVNKIKLDLESGKPLAAALKAHPQCFDEYYVAMIKIGEATGSIDSVFKKLHTHLDFQRRMKDQVKSALRYPVIVVSVILIALGIVNFFVIPAFAKVYQGFNAELPFFTKLLVGISNAMLSYWWVILLLITGIITGFTSWKKSPRGRLLWDEFKLKIPVAGRIAHRATLARFCQSLALAIHAGLPISSAMSLVGDTSDNAWLAEKIEKIKNQIERGESLYKSCLASEAFTSATLQMILVGEESGTLDSMLLEIANLYQEQVEYDLKTIGAQLEPLLLIFMGGLVLFLALGIFLPIWGLSSAAFSHR